MASNDETFMDRVMNEWWGKVVVGLGSLVGGVFLHFEIAKIESGEEKSIRVNWIIKLLYDLGGKWTVAVLVCMLGIGLVCWGIAQRVRGDE